MSQPVQPPKGSYSRPVEGPLHSCPHCGKILNQHLASQPGGDSIRDNGIVPLPPLPEDQGVHATPLAELTAGGDVYVPQSEPELVRRPEQVATNQHRPDKAREHVIPGMRPRETPPPGPALQHRQTGALQALDHPVIGGKVTICVCCFGEEHHNLHRRCLNSIVHSVPPSRMDLRIIANQVGLQSTNYFNSLPVTKIYQDYKNRRKYPAMRQVFWDSKQPIDTNFVIWFDDDSYVRNEVWLSILAQTIAAQKPQERVGMYGGLMYHPLQRRSPEQDPRLWFRNAPWFRNKDFRNQQGRGVPNGDKIHFCVGGFWCLSVEAMRACQIPDTRLNHNGGDICIGEQLWQGGFKMKQFNEKKQYIHTSAAPRRGFSERFPWYK